MPDHFTTALGSARGTGAAPRTHAFAVSGGEAKLGIGASGQISIQAPDGSLFWQTSLRELCRTLCVTDTAQLVNDKERALIVSQPALADLQLWAAAHARERAAASEDAAERADLTAFGTLAVKLAMRILDCQRERERAAARSDELENALKDAAAQLRDCMPGTPRPRRILCDMCGSTTRTRCGRLGCA